MAILTRVAHEDRVPSLPHVPLFETVSCSCALGRLLKLVIQIDPFLRWLRAIGQRCRIDKKQISGNPGCTRYLVKMGACCTRSAGVEYPPRMEPIDEGYRGLS